MSKNKSTLFFIVATFFAIFGHSLHLPILAYSPYLAFTFQANPLLKALWQSFLCGLIADSLQSALPFGSCAFCYTLATLALYKLKRTFFEDKIFSLSIFSTIFSILFSFMQVLIFYFMKTPLHFTFTSFVFELAIMPLCDGVYAFICFTCLYFVFSYIKKKRFSFFFIKKIT